VAVCIAQNVDKLIRLNSKWRLLKWVLIRARDREELCGLVVRQVREGDDGDDEETE
jgi:hypothetical protein